MILWGMLFWILGTNQTWGVRVRCRTCVFGVLIIPKNRISEHFFSKLDLFFAYFRQILLYPPINYTRPIFLNYDIQIFCYQ